MIYLNKEFKRYDDMYFVSEDGEIYSTCKNGILKHNIDVDGYHRVDIHGKHKKVHRLVYEVFGGSIPCGLQVNHIDDDKNNNSFDNLYLGTQSENICDCIKNGHRVGNKQTITVYDKSLNEIHTYRTVRDFLDTTGHSNHSGSLSKVINKKWFVERYVVIEKKGVTTIESITQKSLCEEASRVELNLSQLEACGDCVTAI